MLCYPRKKIGKIGREFHEMNERKGLSNMKPLNIVIIGASFAGISSALTAKKLNPNISVTIIDRQETVGFIPSSINRLLKGKVNQLTAETAHTKQQLKDAGIELLLGQEVETIDPNQKQLNLKNNTAVSYDKLILAMGSVQTSERINGIDHPSVLTTKTLAESLKSQQKLEKSDHILIVGGGQVGLEAADAYTTAGKKVTMVESFGSLAFKSFDSEMIVVLEKRMTAEGVSIYKNQQAEIIRTTEKQLITITSQNVELTSNHVLLAASFRPNTKLVEDQLECHLDRTLVINDYLQTSNPDIYAVGDLIRVPFLGTNNDYYLPLVNTAVITGRIAAMNALGMAEKLQPFVRVAGSQLFGLYIASVGLTEEEARMYYQTTAHTHHQTGEDQKPITVKLITEKKSGRLLGGQIYSEENILELMDTLTTAIKANLTDRDLAFQDYLYYGMDATVTPAIHETAFSIYQKRLKEASADAS